MICGIQHCMIENSHDRDQPKAMRDERAKRWEAVGSCKNVVRNIHSPYLAGLPYKRTYLQRGQLSVTVREMSALKVDPYHYLSRQYSLILERQRWKPS